MERKLASIQRIVKLHKTDKFDNLLLAQVLGWHCLVKKEEFKEGDLCVYFEIDSILPDKPIFAFMNRYRNKVKTIKMHGVYSQGLALPLSLFPELINVAEGQDVTNELGVTKYEGALPICGDVMGNFPVGIPKTDETRLQAIPGILERNKGVECYVTEKIDGCSATYYVYDGKFGVCSRNLELKRSDCVYWAMSDKYKIEEQLLSLGKNIVLQGEIVGPKVQGNKYKLPNQQFYLYNVMEWQGNSYSYTNFDNLIHYSGMLNIPTVPILPWTNYILDGADVDQWVEMSKGSSTLNCMTRREGLVVRGKENQFDIEVGRLSFKVINPDFLLKYE